MSDAEPDNAPPPGRGLVSRILRAMGAQLATQGLRIAQQILLVPFFLKAWGIDVYNDWLVINAAVAFLAIFDGGMQPYFSGLLQEHFVRGDHASYRRAARIGCFNYLAVILLAIVGVGAASLMIDWRDMLKIGSLPDTQAYWTLALLAGSTLLMLPFGIANSAYRAHNEFDRGILMSAGNLAIQIAIPLPLLLMGQSSPIVAASIVICNLITWVIVITDQRLRYGPLPWGLAVPTRAELRLTVAKCLYFATQPITTWMTIQVPLLILGHLAMPAETVAFSTARTLIGVSRQVTLQLAYPFGFEISVLLIRDELAALRRLLESAVSIIGIIGGLLAGVMIAAAAPVTLLWLHGQITVPLSLVVAMAFPIAVSASAQLYQIILAFSNQPRLIAYGVSAYAAIGLLCATLLAPPFGAQGVAVGLAIGEIVGLVIYLPRRTLQAIGLTLGRFQAASILRAMLATALGYGIGWIGLAIVPPDNYPRLVAFGAIWAATAGLSAFFLLLNADQRAVMLRKAAVMRAGLGGQRRSPPLIGK